MTIAQMIGESGMGEDGLGLRCCGVEIFEFHKAAAGIFSEKSWGTVKNKKLLCCGWGQKT